MKSRKKIRMAGGARRAQIVEVATSLFVKKGFKGTTTREIAQKAGISEAVIYKHFARKEDLYTAIIESRCDDDKGEDRLLAALKGKKGREVFGEIAGFLISEHRKDPTILRLMAYSALEKQKLSEEMIKTRGLAFIEILEESIKWLIKDNKIRKVDPTLASRAFLGMVLHYSLSQEVYGMKKYFDWPDDVVADTFVEIFFDGVMRR
jgi:AcrR family transcriptional regulator